MGGGALGLVVLGYMGENAKAAICLYVFVVAIGCCTNVGFNINHLDLAPNYAGILMGFTNAVASVGGVLAPTVCGFIVHDQVNININTWYTETLYQRTLGVNLGGAWIICGTRGGGGPWAGCLLRPARSTTMILNFLSFLLTVIFARNGGKKLTLLLLSEYAFS